MLEAYLGESDGGSGYANGEPEGISVDADPMPADKVDRAMYELMLDVSMKDSVELSGMYVDAGREGSDCRD